MYKIPAFVVSGALACLFVLLARPAAAEVELSAGFSFSQSNYSADSYNWNRRWGASVGYNFSERSGIEISFQDIVDRSHIPGYEDTTFHDNVYSANWIQSLMSRKFPVQPYFKVGVGQLNREASGSYGNGASPPLLVDSITGVLAAGMRIYITRAFAIRSEATSYLSGGSIRTWRDNFGFTVGLSFQL
jgi:hypothetical protein